jgi:hypothetical protein
VPAVALRRLLDELLSLKDVNRLLAGQVSALSTCYPPVTADADPLVGRRVPDVGLTAAGSEAIRVYELLPRGRFVLLDLAGDANLPQALAPGWRSRVTAHAVTDHDEHADLHDVTQALVRPDGHIAWATRATDADIRSSERTAALAAWAGAPAEGDAS